MSLAPGTRLASFEVLGSLGAGAMGEVYRARDTKLGRDVAIKVLPEAWARDPDRLARIDREARVLASLNHPNIASLYGYEEVDGTRFLTMELVPGVDLAGRLARGPMPLSEALDAARQIGEALEEAHAKGVIHRDLKPANVKVTPEGRVKVLDFGLAKVMDIPTLETLSMDEGPTAEGRIAGTPAYMSPEQARGQSLDARTDIWSFGCVLYEMLTGGRAFPGGTLSDTLAAVLEREVDWGPLPEPTWASVRTLLRRCLEKDRRRRLQSIGDARLELEEALRGPVPAGDAGKTPRPRARAALAAAALAALGLVAGAAGSRLLSSDPPASAPWVPRRLVLPLPVDASVSGYSGLAVSPAGDRIAYAAGAGDSSRIYVQDLRAFEPRAVKGTDGGSFPSFSPDGRWLAFQSKGFLHKVAIEGGDPISLGAAPQGATAAWPREDLLLFADPATGALMSLSASGGRPEVFLKIDGTAIGVEPDPLPQNKGVFLTLEGPPSPRLAVLDLGTRRWKAIHSPGRFPHYVPTGHLVYNARADSDGLGSTPPDRWVAAPFDLKRLEVTGTAVDVLGDLRKSGYEPGWVTPHGSGILAYTAVPSQTPAGRALEWIDAAGSRTRLDTEGRDFVPYSAALSPDGQRLALSVREGPSFDLWVSDLQRGTWLRLTTDGHSQSPLWSPDATRIAFASGRDEKDLWWVPSDGGGRPELLAKAGTIVLRPTSFSPDGRRLLFAKGTWGGPLGSVGVSLFSLDLDGARAPRILMEAPYPVPFGCFSPDGRWLVYVALDSGQSGESMLYLRAADLTGRRWAVSRGLGPAWSASGDEILFQQGGRLMSVRMRPDSGPERARVVLEGVFLEGGFAERSFEMDKRRFLIWQPAVEASNLPTRVVVIPNWLEEVRALTRRPRE